MKALVVFIFLLAATFTSNLAMAVDPVTVVDDNDRPAGVELINWLPISERLGFVAVKDKSLATAGGGTGQLLLVDPEHTSADLMPPKKGYFVIKTKTGWQRVVVVDASEPTR